MNQQIKNNINLLVENSLNAIVGSVDENGYPNAKAMFISKREGIHTFWFSTNVSSNRIKQWSHCPKASLYLCNYAEIRGLLLLGEVEIFMDNETKQAFWREGDEQYYSLGPTDPDYCMIRFTAKEGNYWEDQKYYLSNAMIKEI